MLPVAVFAYNRDQHLRRCLEAICQAGAEIDDLRIFVYSDGPKHGGEKGQIERVRNVVGEFDSRLSITLVPSESNRGLRCSIEAGVSELISRFGRVVVLEDDLIIHPDGLRFFEEALNEYESDDRVFQISGYQFPVSFGDGTSNAGFLPIATSWGWASWERAWKHYRVFSSNEKMPWSSELERESFDFGGSYKYSDMLEASIRGEIDSWAIHWYARVRQQEGLTLYPSTTLIINEGFDGSGTHCGIGGQAEKAGEFSYSTNWPLNVEENSEWSSRIQDYLRKESGNTPVTPRGKPRSRFSNLLWRLANLMRSR